MVLGTLAIDEGIHHETITACLHDCLARLFMHDNPRAAVPDPGQDVSSGQAGRDVPFGPSGEGHGALALDLLVATTGTP